MNRTGVQITPLTCQRSGEYQSACGRFEIIEVNQRVRLLGEPSPTSALWLVAPGRSGRSGRAC